MSTSAVMACDYVDLERRGRFPFAATFETVREALHVGLLDFPAAAWRILMTLPDHHRDPVDRMLIAHAIQADLTLVTADAAMRSYPVKHLW